MRVKQVKEDLEDSLVQKFRDAPTRLDRIKAVLLFDELRVLLTNDEDEYLRKLEKAFAVSYKLTVEAEAVTMISNRIIGAERMAYAKQIFVDMHFVFDEFMDRNKELENALYAKRQQHYASAARKLAATTQDFDYVSKIEERAAKAGQYALPPTVEEGETPLPKLLIITSNRAVLETQKRGELADFEVLRGATECETTDNFTEKTDKE
jgi:hypothetical protein